MTTEAETRQRLDALAAQFIKDAKAIDPSITGGWAGYDAVQLPQQRLHYLYLERPEAPFVQQRKGGAA
ncbi:hypothetical protein [Neoaquamicrobium sediminum]|uniref:hypothetical protein n=1 Tax=Neoaquamicrobium sediminum TaxID=1849104 RepID=UPI0015631DA8|nr:hypothetical protein [Mesorhizobium sediminum]NRC52988.1 hypothetical protein [Mesorhizobium sediminum]